MLNVWGGGALSLRLGSMPTTCVALTDEWLRRGRHADLQPGRADRDRRNRMQGPESGAEPSVETLVQSQLRIPERIVALLSAKPEVTPNDVPQMIGKSLRAVGRSVGRAEMISATFPIT